MLIAGIIVLTVCIITGRYVSLGSIGQSSWLALSYLIVFGSLVAYSAYVFMISKLPPTQVSIYAYINPIVAVTLGFIFLHEQLNAVTGISCAVTLIGVYIVNQSVRKSIPSSDKSFEENLEKP